MEISAKTANFLGSFGLGLGIPQLLAPGSVNRMIGVRDDAESRMWQRIVGVRELVAAAGILPRRRPTEFLWARVAGDAMDLALLVKVFGSKRDSAVRLAAATASVAGIAAVDMFTASRFTADPELKKEEEPMHLRTAITVRAPRDEVYAFWRDLENFPEFMAHIESVQVTGDRRSHWKAKGPIGTAEWDAELIEDNPGRLIAWRSLPQSEVPNYGTVRFQDAPGDRGTEVHVDIHYEPPAGRFGVTLAKLFGEEPQQQAADDLRRFKQIKECGLVVRSEGSPEGPLTRRLMRQRPAQPVSSRGGKH
ncbi:MAG: cyclase/dehydrase [Acidobacteria bacterium]|nr:cyclase/dehydrase [Acidobacteriota bacterium]